MREQSVDSGPREGSVIARIFKNAGALVSGKGAAALLSLAYLSAAARTLGPHDMGLLVLAHAYAMTISGIARFQSWQAVIKFGGPMIADNDKASFETLVRYTARIDMLSAIIGVAIALIAAPFAARWLNWSDDVLDLVYVYAFAVPFLMGATPTGVLRLFGKFRTLGVQMTVLPAVRFVGALGAAVAHGGVETFLIVWIVSAFANGASLWALGWHELKTRGCWPRIFEKSTRRSDPAWLPFMIKTNGVSTLDLVNESVPVLIIGGISGASAAGFFQLAQNVTNLIAHPTNMLNHATFPELARVDAAKGRKQTARVALHSAGLAIFVALPVIIIFALFREAIATIVGGPEFRAAGAIIAAMAAYQILRILSVVFESAAVARGKAGLAFAAQALGAFGLITAMVVLLPPLGILAAAIALAIGRLLMLATLSLALMRD